jgi:predicted DNA-binding transcriptional regulator AlpA
MARRKGSSSAGGIAAHAKRLGVDLGASALEPADDNAAICAAFSISKPTLERWRNERGFPRPSFIVGSRSYTWRREIFAWCDAQPKEHPQKGRRPVTGAEAAR